MRRLPALTILVSLILGAWLSVDRHAAARPCEATRLFDDAAARKILATERPFAPGNRDRFFSFERADWADVAPILDAKGPALTEQQTKEALRAFLERRFPCSPGRVEDGLAIYANPVARQKIPDPTLRAALAALTGTLGEPAINYLLYQVPVSAIHFGIVIFYQQGFADGASATVYPQPDGTWQMVVDGSFRSNPFGTLSALLFHEALHIDPAASARDTTRKPAGIGLPEEATAVALESLTYMQMILTDPTLAKLPDPLTRGGSNYMALVRLNSAPIGTDRINLFVPDSDLDIDPISPRSLTEFYEFYAQTSYETSWGQAWHDRETRGNPLLAAVLPALAESGHTPPARPDFDRASLDFIDQNEAVLTPGQLLAVACILELDVPCP